MATLSGSPTMLDRDEQRVRPSFVTANYFSELGATAAAGRLFDATREDSEGSAPVAVLSYRFWLTRYAGDPTIVGKTIHLGGKPATVIGITAESFANIGMRDPDLWLPILQHSYFVDGSKALGDPNFFGIDCGERATGSRGHCLSGGAGIAGADEPIEKAISHGDMG